MLDLRAASQIQDHVRRIDDLRDSISVAISNARILCSADSDMADAVEMLRSWHGDGAAVMADALKVADRDVRDASEEHAERIVLAAE